MSNTALLGSYGGQGNSSLMFRNKIINGSMTIDQRNSGASVTPTTGGYFTVDRWSVTATQSSKFSIQQNAGAVTPPFGFSNYCGLTSLSSYSITASDIFLLNQLIEGFNVADLGWGAAGAQPVALSFWVRSSLTGTFGGALRNSAGNRSYPFTYSISAANTWEQKIIVISGDTSGTWLTNNGVGIRLSFGLGVGSTYSGAAGTWAGSDFYSATGATSVVGTNGATLYITGVQLEAETATPFERRPIGQELSLCQRYFEKSYNLNVVPGTATPVGSVNFHPATASAYWWGNFSVNKRATPVMSYYSPSNGAISAMYNIAGTANIAAGDGGETNERGFYIVAATSNPQGQHRFHWTANAEL